MTVQANIPLASFTTIGLGGAARFFAVCSDVSELRDALSYARNAHLRLHVLGGGSNTIFPDRGFDGLVLHAAMRGMRFQEEDEHVFLRASAGEPWDRTVETCTERGLGGLECLSGIPGLVGATPIQNVGAYGQEVADTVFSVEALNRTSQQKVSFSRKECRFGYRTSRFKQEDADRYVITAVTFSLTPHARPLIRYPELQRLLEDSIDLDTLERGRPALAAVRDGVLKLRRSKSMIIDPGDPNTRSVGSFFTNPVVSPEDFGTIEKRWRAGENADPIPHFPAGSSVKIPAGWLVEHSGFPKGFRKGNVGISVNHALALVNRGGTAAELLALAAEIEDAVRSRFGIRLEREPVIVQ
jgi:UDP-N-acetylmuramate dehydrogenase